MVPPRSDLNCTYENGMSAGKVRGWSIDPNGLNYVAPTGIDVHNDQQVWRVRPDYLTADLTDDAANFFQIDIDSVKAADIAVLDLQYDNDWQNWPATDGAPYEDVDGNGVYDPSIDVPCVPRNRSSEHRETSGILSGICSSLYSEPCLLNSFFLRSMTKH